MAFTKITASGIGSTETVTLDGLSVINDGSFGGNVSVAGTLTYEDVTNIDSVGLITARAGIVVGSGITLSKDGDGFFTGVVTATSYAGDGSALTGIAATDNVRTGILDVAGVSTFRSNIFQTSGKILKGLTSARGNYGNNTSGVEFDVQIEGTSATAAGLAIVRNSNDANDGGIVLGKTRATSTGGNTVVQAGDDLGNITFAGSDGTTLQFGAEIFAEVQSGVGNDDMPTDLVFKTNGGSTSTAERLRIASDGKVTIKTASNATSRLLFENTGSVRTNYIGLFDDDDRVVIAADDDAQGSNSSIHFKVDGTEKMIVSSDQIDINDRLDVIHNGGGNYIAQFENTNTTTPYGTFCNSPTGAAAGYPILSVNQTGASPATKFRVDSGTGRIYINTDTLFSSEYQASLYITSTGGIVFRPDGTSTRKPLAFQNNAGTEVGSISNSTGSTSFNTSSDYRLKENITAISDGITRLKTLKPSRFNFKTDKDTTVDGFIAHEVTAVPEAITGTKDEVNSDNNPVYQSIDQSKLVPLLTAALQEAVTKIEALEARVATLEGS